MSKQQIDIKRAIEMYELYGTMNRAALSIGCSPHQLKKILIENNVEIKKYTPKPFHINSVRTTFNEVCK